MVFTHVISPRSAVNCKREFKKNYYKKGATIGANATIICGNTIGEYAFVGEDTVDTRYVIPFALVIGNPARQLGWISEFGHRLHFDNEGHAQCTESKTRYRRLNCSVKKMDIIKNLPL